MTVPRARLDDGHFGIFQRALDERRAAAGDEDVQRPLPHELPRALTRAVGEQLDELRIEAAARDRPFDDGDDGGVGAIGVLAAAQDDGVAALDAQPDRVRRNVGTRFIDDADDAERDPDAGDIQPALRRVPLDDLANGAGERDELFQTLRDARNARLVEHKAILELRAARAGGNLLRVDGDDLSGVRDERVGSQREHLVLVRIRRKGDRRSMLFCHAAGLGNSHDTLLMRAARRVDRRGGRRHIKLLSV